MGVRILEGTKINEGPFKPKGAILYCSTTGTALPMMFESGDEAQRFLDWLGDDPRRDEGWAMKKWGEWVDADKPGPLNVSEDDEFDQLLDDLRLGVR